MLSKVCNWTGHFCHACEALWRNLEFTRAPQTMMTDLETAHTDRIYHSKLLSVWLSVQPHYYVWALNPSNTATQEWMSSSSTWIAVPLQGFGPRLRVSTWGLGSQVGKAVPEKFIQHSSSSRLATRTAILGVRRYIASLKSSISSLKLISLLSTSRSSQEELFIELALTWKACTKFQVETTYTQALQWEY